MMIRVIWLIVITFSMLNCDNLIAQQRTQIEKSMSYKDREWQIYKNRTQLSFKPFAKISRAKGWNSMTDWSASWVGKDNMIDGIDTFKKWEFGIVSLKPSGKEYLYLKKTFSRKNYSSRYQSLYESQAEDIIYFLDIDYTKYSNMINNLSGKDNILTFNIITRRDSDFPDDFLKIVADDPYWNFELEQKINRAKERVEEKIEDKYNGKIKGERADRLIASYQRELEALQQRRSTDDDKLAIKFRLNKEGNWARFLIYYTDYNNYINLGSFEYSYEQGEVIIDNVTEHAILNSDKLWESFYYETDYNSFIKFIESPLKKLK